VKSTNPSSKEVQMEGNDAFRGVAAQERIASAHDKIALRAYQLWQERGCPIGSPQVDWLRAEREIHSQVETTALLLDGGFVRKKLQQLNQRFPMAEDIVGLCKKTIMSKRPLRDASISKIYFYDASPIQGTVRNPLDGRAVNLSSAREAVRNQSLLQALKREPNFAVRLGFFSVKGWRLRGSASAGRTTRGVAARDFVPDIIRNGGDMQVGLDIAWLSMNRIVDSVVVVTGRSAFAPAMRFAQRHGIRVYLEALGDPVERALHVHADAIL
jgi:uncharacterized LabA/DUF88 family protein